MPNTVMLSINEQKLSQYIDGIQPGSSFDIDKVKEIFKDSDSYNDPMYKVNFYNALYRGLGNKAMYRDGTEWKVIVISQETVRQIKFGNAKRTNKVYGFYDQLLTNAEQHVQYRDVPSTHVLDSDTDNENDTETLLNSIIDSHKYMNDQGCLSDEMVDIFNSCAEELIEKHPGKVLSIIIGYKQKLQNM